MRANWLCGRFCVQASSFENYIAEKAFTDRFVQQSLLKLTLHHGIVGYLAGFQSGKNILVFTDSFRSDQQRPTLSLLTSPLYPQVDKILEKTYVTHQRLHPLLSNLLPEGALRELIAQSLKVHIDNEFQLLAALGHDLPGALIATPLDPEEIPDEIKFKLQISNPDQILVVFQKVCWH